MSVLFGVVSLTVPLVRPLQVSQLYDVVQKWDGMATSIPQVVQRLVAVKELHEQGTVKTSYWLHPIPYPGHVKGQHRPG